MTRTSLTSVLVVCLASSLLAEQTVVRVDSREALIAALSAAKPGTTIEIAPGTYGGGLSHRNLRGEEGKPIVIQASDPKQPPVLQGGGSVLHLAGPAHIELRDLVITKGEGNGLNIDDGGDPGQARHITLSGLVVKENGSRGNHDGIKLSGLDEFRVENCTVDRWGGSGSALDMVGCHQGTITGCTFRHEKADLANGVQAKGGSSEIQVQRCRFENAGGRAINIGGSTGLAFFRPKPQGYEAKDITVEDCTIIGSPIAFVGVDGAVVRHNTLYRPRPWTIRILQENQDAQFVACRNGRFEHNLIAFRSDEVRTTVNVGGKTQPETFTFQGNHWYCLDRPNATQRAVQLPVRETDGTYGVNPQFTDAEKGDLSVTSAEVKAGVRPASSAAAR